MTSSNGINKIVLNEVYFKHGLFTSIYVQGLKLIHAITKSRFCVH